MPEYWVLTTGSRDYRDSCRVESSLLAVQRKLGVPGAAVGVVHGAARGADRPITEHYGVANGVCRSKRLRRMDTCAVK